MKRKSFLLFAIPITFLIFLIITIRSEATRFSATNLTPTIISPTILTQPISTSISIPQPPPTDYFAQVTQAYLETIQAAATPFPTHSQQDIFPIFYTVPGINDILASKLEGTPAGYGLLMEDKFNWYGDADYELSGLIWKEWTYSYEISVRGGHVIDLPQQGIVWTQLIPHHSGPQSQAIVQSPVQAGTLNITGAVGERLILKSDQGETFYFDVPALQFVNSLEESAAVATPYPTQTLPPPLAPTDDAPDLPFYVYDTQLEDNDVNYYINSPGDYDWFHFLSQANGTLKVSLVPRGKNYGLRVVFVDENDIGTIVGEDTTAGGGIKQVTIPNASSGNYMVRVWSLDGSYDESQPYTVRFEPPKPEKITPILECIDENSGGTFTAHFGYDNPNSSVILINANHNNAFHPGPIFRTGQPEYFAPGRVKDWFVLLFDGNELTWTLDGQAVTANRNSPRCP